MTIRSDDEAVAAMGAGDNEAFRDLYDRYAPRGLSYARSLLHDRNDSEEALQEAFCRLLGPIERGAVDPARGGFRALFFATIRNLCIDAMRRRKKEAAVPLDAATPEAPASRDAADGVRTLEETEARVRAAMAALPERQARALSLRLHAKLSYAGIADRLGCTRAQVRTWIYRARRTLEERFIADGLLRPPAGKKGGRS